jgi:hypothetical protein
MAWLPVAGLAPGPWVHTPAPTRRRGQPRQWQIGHNTRPRRAFVDQDLAGALQDAFHGFDVKPARGHVLRHFVGVVNRLEARGIALRLQHDLGAVSLRLLLNARGVAMCARHDVVAIGFRLVDEPLQIDLRALHVAEGIDHRIGRIDFRELHAIHIDARAIEIEDLLQQRLRVELDLAAAFGERARDLGVADHLAHRAFRGGFHRELGIADVEEIGLCVLHQPKHREVDIDDVLIAGEHQGFLGHFGRARATARREAGTVADLDAIDARDRRRQRLFDRPRPMIIETRRRWPVIGAEMQHDALLIRLDTINAAGEPKDDDKGRAQPPNSRSAANAAGQNFTQCILELAQRVVEIGRLESATATAAARSPRTRASPAAPWAAATSLVPGHRLILLVPALNATRLLLYVSHWSRQTARERQPRIGGGI